MSRHNRHPESQADVAAHVLNDVYGRSEDDLGLRDDITTIRATLQADQEAADENKERRSLPSSITSAQVKDTLAQIYTLHGHDRLPNVNVGRLTTMLQARQRELQRVEAERARARERRNSIIKRVGITGVALAGVGGAALGIVKGIQAIHHHSVANELAFESSHWLSNKPTSTSYTGWKVSYPSSNISSSHLEILPKDLANNTLTDVVQNGGEIVLGNGAKNSTDSADTGISVSQHHLANGAHALELTVTLQNPNLNTNNSNKSVPTQKVLLDPAHPAGSSNLLLFQRSGSSEEYLVDLERTTANGPKDNEVDVITITRLQVPQQ
jgi:hypothetical protein